jgi:cytochrome c5
MAATHFGWKLTVAGAMLVTAVVAITPVTVSAERKEPASQPTAMPSEVTFTKHIAPILQRSCQNCHRADGVAPMPLTTYEEARPWARAIKNRTGIGPRAGVMPPWYIEKNVGIQHYKDDISLSDIEIATVAKWADTGAVRGNS